jgi:hypothetical protein
MVQAHRTARARSALGQLGQQQVNRPEVYSTLLVEIVGKVALVLSNGCTHAGYIRLYLLFNIFIMFGLRQLCQGIASSSSNKMYKISTQNFHLQNPFNDRLYLE